MDGRLDNRPFSLSSVARLRNEARRQTSFRSLQQLARLFCGCVVAARNAEGQIRRRLTNNQNGYPGAGKVMRAKVCESCSRFALPRATFHRAAHRAHHRSRLSPLSIPHPYGGRAALQQVSSTQWQKPSVLQERHVSCAQKRAFKTLTFPRRSTRPIPHARYYF